MTNRSRRFPYSADQVCAILAQAAPENEDWTARSGEIMMLGPLPLYEVVHTKNSNSFRSEQVGWRGLIRADKDPIAIVDFPMQDGTQTLPSAIIRRAEAAFALDEALRVCADEIGSENTASYSEIRFLRFASAFVTAIWLHGRRPAFVPTRLGCGARPRILVVHGRKALLELVQQNSK